MRRQKEIEEILTGFHRIKRNLACQVKQSGLTHSQWMALTLIRENEGVGIKKIAEALSVSSSAATQMVDDLENNGFVIRKSGENDKRAIQLILTEKALDQFIQMRRERVKAFSGYFDALSDEEFAQYFALSKKIANHIQNI